MSNAIENDKQISAAFAAGASTVGAEGRVANYEGLPLVAEGNGIHVHLMGDLVKALDERAPFPRRRRGSTTITELMSFCDFVNRHKVGHEKRTVAHADTAHSRVRVVFNASDDAGAAGWADDVVTYTCPLTDEWKFWNDIAGRGLGQVAFAELLDAHLDDLAGGENTPYPAPAALLEMARNLLIEQRGKIQRKLDPVLGQTLLVQETENGPQATKIPRAFGLGIRVFEGGARWQVEARLSMAIRDGLPVFTIKLHNADVVLKTAFDDVRKTVAESCGIPVYAASW